MSIHTPESRLSRIVMSQPGCLPVLQRFGIRLGVGDRTVGEECVRLGIDEGFFLAVLNTYLDSEYAPGHGGEGGAGGYSLADAPLDALIDYLSKTDDWYEAVQLPNIERHFGPLIASGRGTGNLHLLGTFFEGLRKELTQRIEADRSRLFPALEGRSEKITAEEVSGLLDADFSIEEKVSDLESFFVIHLTGGFDANLCVAVVSAIFALGRDLRQNNRIRQRLLRPLAQKAFGG